MILLRNSEGGIPISLFILIHYPFGVPRGKVYDRNGN